MENASKPTLAKRFGATLAAALIASCMMAPMAFAAGSTDDDGGKNSPAATDLIVKVKEYTVSSDPAGESGVTGYGQDAGKNVKFSIPSEIHYTLNEDGTLTQDGSANEKIKNTSDSVSVHLSNMKVVAEAGWNIVSGTNYGDAASDNAVKLNIWNTTNKNTSSMDVADYSTKSAVNASSDAMWNLYSTAAKDNDKKDTLELSSEGAMKNLKKDITSDTTFAKVTWYVTTGLIAAS